MILLVLIMATRARATPIVNRGQGYKCEEDRVVRTRENVTRMVNVTDTVHELCLDLSEGFRCTRQLTHFVPRLTVETREHVETVTSCCPGYISDHNDECVQIRAEEEGSGWAVRDADLAQKTETNDLMSDGENLIPELLAPFFTQPVEGTRCGPKCCQCPPPFNVVDLGEKNDQCFCFHRPEEASESMDNHQLEEEQMEMETANFTMDEDSVENFQCAAFRWGRDCSLVCHCNYDGAYGCHRESGQCICNSYWSGEKCEKNDNVMMFVVLGISLLLLTLLIIGTMSINILRRTYYDLERKRKIMENKKARSMVSSMRSKNHDGGKVYPKTIHPLHPSFDNPTYGLLNNGYETENSKSSNWTATLKEVVDKMYESENLKITHLTTLKEEDIDTQLDPDIQLAEHKNSETDEYDHLDYNRSIYINDLSENYCSGSPAPGIQQAPAISSLSGEACSGTHV